MNQPSKTFPNLFLLGAPKSGTTFIYGLMQNAPDVFTSEFKEPAYFFVHGQKIKYKDRFVKQPASANFEDDYVALYQGRAERLIIDASTHYLSSPESAARIHAANPDAKVIAVLREPIGRAYSHYLMGVRDGFVQEAFPEALGQEIKEMQDDSVVWAEHYRFIRRSLYLDGLKAFHALFGDKMRIYMFEDVKADPNFIIDDLCAFLDLQSSDLVAQIDEAARNPYAVDRYPLLTRLLQRYRETPLRPLVNKLTPVYLRDKLRIGFEKKRLQKAEKPKLCDDARNILIKELGDDYEASIAFAKAQNILRQSKA